MAQFRADSEKQALPGGTLFSPGLVANGGHGATESRDRTFVPNISVARRRAEQTEGD